MKEINFSSLIVVQINFSEKFPDLEDFDLETFEFEGQSEEEVETTTEGVTETAVP